MKRLISMVLAVLLLVGTLPVTVLGAQTVAEGSCGENAVWTLDEDGTLIVSGTGEMKHYSSQSETPWYAHRDNIKTIIVEEGITGLGLYAFCGTAVERAVLPASLVYINGNSFADCDALVSVQIAEGLKAIYSSAFAGCDGLSGIILPESLTNLYGSAFRYCTGLTSIRIPSGIRELDVGVFDGCTALAQVDLPEGLTKIWNLAFGDCVSLKEIDIPGTVSQISDMAFSGCSGLERIEIPDGVTELSAQTFLGCSNLKEIILPDSLETIHADAFDGCSSVTQLVIPEKVVSVGCLGWMEHLEGLFFLGDAPQIVDDTVFNYCKQALTVYHLADAAGWSGTEWYGKPLEAWGYTYSGPSDCTEPGYETYTSEEYGLTYTRYNKDRQHTAGEWILGQPAAEGSDGWWESVCIVCGETVTKSIPGWLPTEQEPAVSNKAGTYEWARPEQSFLLNREDGGYTRVEFIEGLVTIEQYGSDLRLENRKVLEAELELFGGFYSDGDYHYLLYGQSNPRCDNQVEVLRIVRYDRDWNRMDETRIFGAYTSEPFYTARARMVSHGGVLYLNTAHNMYNGHQASMLFAIQISTMSVIDSLYFVEPGAYGYVSHSLDQFILEDNGYIVKLDEGDGSPRAFQITKFTTPAGGPLFRQGSESVELMQFIGEDGVATTGAESGGFAVMQSQYLLAGKSILQDGTVELNGQQNIFIATVPKDNLNESAVELVWLTDYADGSDVTISTPHFVKINDETGLILWTEELFDKVLHYAIVDEKGNLQGEIHTADGLLSDCQPILSGNRVIWYVTKNTQPVFYWIDLDAPEALHTDHAHDAQMKIAEKPNHYEPGILSASCRTCGEELETVELPILSETDYSLEVTTAPTCTSTGRGVYTWNCTDYGTVTVEAWLPMLEHAYGDWYTVEDPTCVDSGKKQHECTVCGYSDWDYIWPTGHNYVTTVVEATCTEKGSTTIRCDGGCGYQYVSETDALGHNWDEGKVTKEPTEEAEGERTFTCERCGETKTESVPKLEHVHRYTEVVTEPTCTERGFTTYTCTCGVSYVDDYTEALGHDWDEGKVTKEPTEESEGERTYTCKRCGETMVESVPKLEHVHRYTEVVTEPTCTERGFTTYTCTCGDSYVEDYTEALGHDWDEGKVTKEPTEEIEGERTYTCERCGETRTESVPKLEHVHRYTAVVTEASCTEDGYTTYTCICGNSYVEDYTEALGHDWDEGKLTKEPTEEIEGERTYTCERCGKTRTESVPKLDHVHRYTAEVTEATCTEGGYTTYTCTCGDSYVEDYTEALGHSWDEGVVTKEPTPEQDGEKTYTCTRCAAVKSAKYHVCFFGAWTVWKEPTSTEEGEERKYCRCGGCISRSIAVLTNPFADVKPEDYFFEPVLWAAYRGITAGTSATTFSPNATCTRAQIVTFLWRAMGKPEPVSRENPFNDVTEGSYYYDAVLWAVENGITAGTGAYQFSPDRACTRDQVVTFLWRAMGKPEPEKRDNTFADVDENAYYYLPVLWAVEHGITAGTGAGLFSPGNPCTRAQVATFLYRTLKQK